MEDKKRLALIEARLDALEEQMSLNSIRERQMKRLERIEELLGTIERKKRA